MYLITTMKNHEPQFNPLKQYNDLNIILKSSSCLIKKRPNYELNSLMFKKLIAACYENHTNP